MEYWRIDISRDSKGWKKPKEVMIPIYVTIVFPFSTQPTIGALSSDPNNLLGP